MARSIIRPGVMKVIPLVETEIPRKPEPPLSARTISMYSGEGISPSDTDWTMPTTMV